MKVNAALGSSVAILGGYGLGDNLIEMVLAENARRAGLQSTMYSKVLQGLADWFPAHRIKVLPPPDQWELELTPYDRILAPKGPEAHLSKKLSQRWIPYEGLYRDDRSQVRNMMAISDALLGCDGAIADNGIRPPGIFHYRRYPKRVCLHPTSAELRKNWLPNRFIELGLRLASKSFQPLFIMSKGEEAIWRPILGDMFPLIAFASLADCAAFIYESGFFIGNDSGGGHLAACLRIPTLSIHGRRKKSLRWRPDWGEVEVVSPRYNLVGASLRQWAWKYLLPVSQVEAAFERLAKRCACLQNAN